MLLTRNIPWYKNTENVNLKELKRINEIKNDVAISISDKNTLPQEILLGVKRNI